MSAQVPAPRPALDRAALERVLVRAAQLQGESTATEPAGALTDEQVVELGREVGLSPETIRQAIAEERANVAIGPARGPAGWFGPGTFAATRVVPGTPESTLIAIDVMLRGDLPFEVRRRFPDRVHWEPRRSFIEAVRAQFIRGIEGSDLRLAQEVATSVTVVDESRTHVRVDAILSDARRRAVIASVNTVAAVAVIGAILIVLGFTPVLVVPPLAIAAGGIITGFRRGYRQTVSRVVTAIEQILDRLEFGPARKRGVGLAGRPAGEEKS